MKHVDFGMMIDQALKLEVPERVPFRLTQNMVDAMGVGMFALILYDVSLCKHLMLHTALLAAGYEGTFRRVSEITIGILRRNREMLMSVLESFIHDPLLEWKGSGQRGESAQVSVVSFDDVCIPNNER